MTPNGSPNASARPVRRGARLRLAGVIVLAAGMAWAAFVYWQGTRSPDFRDDVSMVGYNRAQRRQMGQLYGRMGTIIEDWSEELKRPINQALLIAGITVVVAGVCFHFARLSANDDRLS